MNLWDWALGAYARDGVADACLSLQDDHRQNIAYLLWAVWAEGPDEAALLRAAELVRGWDDTAVKPLREVRRRLKAAFPGIEDRAREGLREDVKAAELRAERVVMEALEQISGAQAGGRGALASLQAASRAWGVPASDEAMAMLARALS